MKEQIEEIYEVLVTDCGMPCHECDYEGDDLCVAHRKAEALYNAGYRKQKEGRWKGAGLGDYYCSLCCATYSGGDEYHFRPNCGSKMKGDAE